VRIAFIKKKKIETNSSLAPVFHHRCSNWIVLKIKCRKNYQETVDNDSVELTKEENVFFKRCFVKITTFSDPEMYVEVFVGL
jgi:hypothetical protein